MGDEKVRVQRTRNYKPHRHLQSAAELALESAESERPGCYFDQLSAILLSALALEAMGNTFGALLYDNWDDFESSSPIAKIRLVADKLDVVIDRTQEPWAAMPWLIKVRNRLAHGRPESVDFDKTMTRKEADKIRYETPESKIEKEITLMNAKRACRVISQIYDLLFEALPDDLQSDLFGDSWHGSISVVRPEEG